MINSEEKLLVDMMLEAGVLTEEDLEDAMKLQEANGGSLKDVLIEREHISQVDINSEHSDFGVEYYDSGFVFLSARDQDLFIQHQPSSAIDTDETMLDLYYTRFDAFGNLSLPDHFHKKLNSPYHEGPLAFFEGNRKIIFTRNNYHEGKAGRSSDERIKVMLVTAELDDEHAATARALKPGTWVEFRGKDGKGSRAKLSWISPITKTCLFTDRMGCKAANLTVAALAHHLRCARVRILNTAPLLDRAVTTALKNYLQH